MSVSCSILEVFNRLLEPFVQCSIHLPVQLPIVLSHPTQDGQSVDTYGAREFSCSQCSGPLLDQGSEVLSLLLFRFYGIGVECCRRISMAISGNSLFMLARMVCRVIRP